MTLTEKSAIKTSQTTVPGKQDFSAELAQNVFQ